MDPIDSYLSRVARGFDKVVTNHESVLNNRIEETKDGNTSKVTRDTLESRVNSGLWSSLSPDEKNIWLYG